VRRRSSAAPPRPWWSGDVPPWEKWPGVSLKLDAVWNEDRARWESADAKYWFDADAADAACDSFKNYLRHTKGEWAGRPFELLPWQADLIVRPLFAWKRSSDGARRFRKVFVEVAKKAGKALALDTPIPTPGGWTTMGALQPGEFVLGVEGRPVRVVGATGVMRDHPCFRLRFSDGTTVVADAEHLWYTLVCLPGEHNASGCLSTTRQIRDTVGSRHLLPASLSASKGIVAVEPVPSVPVRCIEVQARDGLFLVGEGSVPTHNSGLASGLGLLLAFGDGEPGAEVYAVAADRDQARIVFGDAKTMARMNPDFLAAAGIEVLQNAIVQSSTNSTFKALSAEVGTKHGFNVHGLIVDEFHAQRSRDLFDALYKGTSARRQPVIFIITTAGDDRESICYEEYQYAKNVRDGVIPDEQYLAVVFESDPSEDWTDEAVWHKSNPSLGVTKSLEYMRAECEAAQAEPRKRNSFLRLELNRWTESRTVWISPETWEACARKEREIPDAKSLVACAGLDLSSTTDLTACVVAFRRPDPRSAQQIEVDAGDDRGHPRRVLTVDFSVDLLEWFWLPREVLRERARKDRVPYDTWARDGWLGVTDGDMVDYRQVHETLDREIRAKYQLGEVGYDPWNAQQLALALADDGFKMVEVRQGYGSLSAPAKLFEALVRARRITYSGSPLMRWCVANCEVSSDAAGNIKPVKPSGAYSATRRIDGVVAALIALQRLMLTPEPEQSVYATRGVQVIRW
jgi:phage terminase large subunit-like protein